MSKVMQCIGILAVLGMTTSWAVAGPCGKGKGRGWGRDGNLPEGKQQKLLDKFGEEGIDADGDGTLTHQEVRDFFAARDEDCPGKKGKWGKRGHGRRGGFGGRGMRGHGPMALKHLDLLESETPPGWFQVSLFPEADTDGNGELDAAEWGAFADTQKQKMLERMAARHAEFDTNEDGRLGEEELAALTANMRERLLERHSEADTDGDGVLSEAEYDAFVDAKQAEHRAMILEHNPEADTDGDGTLSAQEFDQIIAQHMAEHRARVLQRHPEADTNEDGVLSFAEMQEFSPGMGGLFMHGKGGPGHRGHKGWGHRGHKDCGRYGKGKGHGHRGGRGDCDGRR